MNKINRNKRHDMGYMTTYSDVSNWNSKLNMRKIERVIKNRQNYTTHAFAECVLSRMDSSSAFASPNHSSEIIYLVQLWGFLNQERDTLLAPSQTQLYCNPLLDTDLLPFSIRMISELHRLLQTAKIYLSVQTLK